ncbi:hypothetical protein D0Y65_015669 [Glycine soja]|uniref:Uncharacterized protein n=1 Tax=Glycine soja TaxID=3848 RepID=A0A445KDX0_GLYSO|nr:hypothetical protein D0Y65_015669 [Glycine soja]
MCPPHTSDFDTSTPSKTLATSSKTKTVIFVALRSQMMLSLSINILSTRALHSYSATRRVEIELLAKEFLTGYELMRKVLSMWR